MGDFGYGEEIPGNLYIYKVAVNEPDAAPEYTVNILQNNEIVASLHPAAGPDGTAGEGEVFEGNGTYTIEEEEVAGATAYYDQGPYTIASGYDSIWAQVSYNEFLEDLPFLPTTVSWTLYKDGNEIDNGTTALDTPVTYDDPEAGTYKFVFSCSLFNISSLCGNCDSSCGELTQEIEIVSSGPVNMDATITNTFGDDESTDDGDNGDSDEGTDKDNNDGSDEDTGDDNNGSDHDGYDYRQHTDNEDDTEIMSTPEEQPVLVAAPTPEPTVPEIITVPEPTPELPKTGAAPIASGIGLILAAGGLALRKIEK